MADVFLSYDHGDSVRASTFTHGLEKVGISAFWDRRLEGGDEWPDVLERELRAASMVVVLWSEKSVKSRYVLEEARLALDLGTLVPALIDEVEVPFGFGGTQAYRVPNGEPGSDDFQKLVKKLEKEAGAKRAAGERVGTAFRLRARGDFEGATRELKYAFEAFERILDISEKARHDKASNYKKETLDELRVIAKDEFRGSLEETLSGLSLLPIVDAVLELDMEPVLALLGPECDHRLADLERLRVGAVVRPGSKIDNDLLVSRLLKETEGRIGPLDLHCFLLIMNTADPGPGVSFTALAERRKLSAKCINWRPEDGPDVLADRLTTTILTVCSRDNS